MGACSGLGLDLGPWVWDEWDGWMGGWMDGSFVVYFLRQPAFARQWTMTISCNTIHIQGNKYSVTYLIDLLVNSTLSFSSIVVYGREFLLVIQMLGYLAKGAGPVPLDCACD